MLHRNKGSEKSRSKEDCLIFVRSELTNQRNYPVPASICVLCFYPKKPFHLG